MASFGFVLSQVAISWLTLALTGSPLAVGSVFAAQFAPQLLLGIPAGALADAFDRRRVIITSCLLEAATATAMGVLATTDHLSLNVILLLMFGMGAFDSLRTIATQAYAYDLVGSSQAMKSIATTNLGAELFGSAGAVVGGYTIQRSNALVAFAIVASAWACASLILFVQRDSFQSFAAGRTRSKPDVPRTVSLLLRNRNVAFLCLVVILAEIWDSLA